MVYAVKKTVILPTYFLVCPAAFKVHERERICDYGEKEEHLQTKLNTTYKHNTNFSSHTVVDDRGEVNGI